MSRNIKSKKFRMFTEQDERCIYCGFPMCYSVEPQRLKPFSEKYNIHYRLVKKMLICTVDHLVALSEGGTYRNTNLVAAHSYCNSKKQSTCFEKFALTSEIQVMAKTHPVIRWFVKEIK